MRQPQRGTVMWWCSCRAAAARRQALAACQAYEELDTAYHARVEGPHDTVKAGEEQREMTSRPRCPGLLHAANRRIKVIWDV